MNTAAAGGPSFGAGGVPVAENTFGVTVPIQLWRTASRTEGYERLATHQTDLGWIEMVPVEVMPACRRLRRGGGRS